MKNKNVQYIRNPKGQYVGAYRTTTRLIVGTLLVFMGIVGAYRLLVLDKKAERQEAQAYALPDECYYAVNGLHCNFTTAETKETFQILEKHGGVKWIDDSKPEVAEPVIEPAPLKSVYKAPAKPRKMATLSAAQQKNLENIIRIAKEENYSDVGYLLALADCESSFNPAVSNVHGNYPAKSKDRGLFMFNSHWHPDVSNTCAYNADCATRMAIKKIKGGTSWSCNPMIKSDGRLAYYRDKFNGNEQVAKK